MRTPTHSGWLALGLLALLLGPVVAFAPRSNRPDAERGRYLVEFGGCHDCHSPKIAGAGGPVPDTTRLLSGHPADVKVPPIPAGLIKPDGWQALAASGLTAWGGPWGVSFSANLTPDPTGLGNWTVEQFIQTMRTGRHLGAGRPILPPMPWYDVAKLTDEDLRSVFAYLRTLKPVDNAVPAPLPASTAAR